MSATSDDDAVQAGLEHLQRAAREVIAASRALLDVAEELVDDPKAAAGIAEVLGTVANRVRSTVARFDDEPHHAPDEDEPPVQRIPVS